jgi:hypothetical protein
MFFRHASCTFANSDCFLVDGIGMVFTNVDHEDKIHWQDSSQLCSHVHSLFSCKPEGTSPLASLANRWDHSETLMSLRELGSPKKQCQIHEYSKATTSRTLVGSRLFLVAHCVTSISLCPLSWELEDRPTQIHESSRTHTHTCTWRYSLV